MISFSRTFKYILFFLGIVGCLWASAELPGLKEIYKSDFHYGYEGGETTGEGIRNFLVHIFKNGGIVVFTVAVILVFVSVMILITGKESEEDFQTWTATLIWSATGMFTLSVAYTIIKLMETRVLSEQTFSATTVYNMTINIVYPLLNFLRFFSAAFFILGAFFSFYKIVTSAGGEESLKYGVRAFMSAVVGFILIMFTEPIVQMAYGTCLSGSRTVFGVPIDCSNRIFNVVGSTSFIARVIIFLNGFLALIIIIMLMYAGFLIMTGAGDEEKSDKAKRIVLYSIIGIIILIFSYVLYRFMILRG